MTRIDGRKRDEIRNIKIKKGFLKFALGSCLIEIGDTKVVCSASLQEKVPPFLRNTGKGWITAEYGMLPASCSDRIEREASRGKIKGRTSEIQRLIGRSLRAVVDLAKLGERSIFIDCDVIQGDGGTRTAGITGSFVALAEAIRKMRISGKLKENPLRDYVAAVSVGICSGEAVVDLCYKEDVIADVDMNVVMTGSGEFIEVQGTAEHAPFSKKQMDELLALAKNGVAQMVERQKALVVLK